MPDENGPLQVGLPKFVWVKQQLLSANKDRRCSLTEFFSLFIQARGVLKKELMGHLRSRPMMRRSKRASTAGQPRGQIIDGLSIRDHLGEVDDRAIPGHWEGELIAGSRNTHMAMLVERQSRFTMLVKIPGKDTASVVKAPSKHVRTLPAACADR